MRTLVVCVAVCFVLVYTKAALAAGCSHPKSAEILRELGSNASIVRALDLLKKHKMSFMILYRSDARSGERATTPEKLSSLAYHSLTLSVQSHFPGGFIVSSDEFLSLKFSSRGIMTGSSCRRVYTGP